MKKKCMLFLVLAMLWLSAVSVSAATTVPTDVGSPSAGCTFLGIEGKYIVQIPEALARINEIRQEACQEGVINPSSGKPLTMADYVPIKWSSDLEYIARIRAAEASLTMAHTRTNGSDCFAIQSPNSVRSYGEVLAWNWSETMIYGINQWYEEKSDWVNQNQNAVTGHYTAMIDPKNLYVGLGTFCSKTAKYYNSTAGEFTFETGLDEAQGTGIDNCIQILEVSNSYLNNNYTISGSNSGKKGDRLQLNLSAEVTMASTTTGLLTLSPVTWVSSNPTVASVDATGTVTANLCGSTAITATDSNGKTGTITFTVAHVEVKDAAVATSCAKEGKTEGSHCSACNTVIKKQETIPKTDHKWDSGKVTKEATDTSTGVKTYTCTVCNTTKTQEIPKTSKKDPDPTETVKLSKTTLLRVSNTKKNKMTVKWKKNTTGSGYQIQYSTRKNFASGKKTVNIAKKSTTSKTIGGLKKGKTYYVRIRTCKTVSGEKYYSKWGKAKKIKISK